MAIQVIYLDEEDDIASICDRLDWARESQIILVLPPKQDVLIDYLELALLRRQADSLRIELGLVTNDSRVRSQAKALGFPIFRSIRSATKNRRRWWRGRRRYESVGQPTRIDEPDKQEEKRRRSDPRPWQRWSLRYLTIILYIFTLALLFVAAVYTVPGATISLEPEVHGIRVSKQIVVDPELETIDASGASVPGRVLSSVQEWQAEVETTGTLEVADSPATGVVVFVNQLEQPVTVPAGTRVSTTTGKSIVFQTTEPVEVPGVIGGTINAEIVAIEPGIEGNVSSNLINRLEGPLALQLDVRNLEPTAGGASRSERTVTEADQQRLRSQVMQQLQVRALADMETMLSDREFLARESLRLVETLQETYSHFPAERTDRLTLEIRAELQATAVDDTQAIGLVYEELANSVTEGFELVPESLMFSDGKVLGVDGQGRVTFEMIGEGVVAARLAVDEHVDKLTGQETGMVATYLFEEMPLREYPIVRVWPDWFGRLPYLPIRIRTQIETGV